jgi:hypothetical protein
MLKKVVVFFAILTAMASFSVASASQLVRVLQGNTLWGITEALGQPGSSWTQLYPENRNLPPITVDRHGRNIAVIHAGDYLQVPDSWNLGSADQGYVEVYPGYVLPSTSSIVSTSGAVNPLTWMGSVWFQVLVVGTVLLLVFVLGAVLVRCFGQPMYGGFPGMPMFQPMRNEVNITYAGLAPATPVVASEAPAPAAPVVASESTVPAAPVADVTPAESAIAKTETP